MSNEKRHIIQNPISIIPPESGRTPNDGFTMPYGWGQPDATYYDKPHFDGAWIVPLRLMRDGSTQFEHPFNTLAEAISFYELSSGHCY